MSTKARGQWYLQYMLLNIEFRDHCDYEKSFILYASCFYSCVDNRRKCKQYLMEHVMGTRVLE